MKAMDQLRETVQDLFSNKEHMEEMMEKVIKVVKMTEYNKVQMREWLGALYVGDQVTLEGTRYEVTGFVENLPWYYTAVEVPQEGVSDLTLCETRTIYAPRVKEAMSKIFTDMEEFLSGIMFRMLTPELMEQIGIPAGEVSPAELAMLAQVVAPAVQEAIRPLVEAAEKVEMEPITLLFQLPEHVKAIKKLEEIKNDL